MGVEAELLRHSSKAASPYKSGPLSGVSELQFGTSQRNRLDKSLIDFGAVPIGSGIFDLER